MDCFHCGEPVPDANPVVAHIGDQDRLVCCVGCKAVAELIQGSGLGAFYQFRSQPQADLNLRPDESGFAHFNAEDMLTRYVHRRGSAAEVTLDIGGMYCSACVWLLDNALQRFPAITSIDVNPATRRAVISWDLTALGFGDLLQAIAAVGFKPVPVGAGSRDQAGEIEYRQALKRLIVAAAAGMQVMMFAVALYAGDYFGIEGGVEEFLRTISLLVTLPIIFYSARPFFAGAWRGIRARTPGMDLPVSIAIAAAFCASAWAVWTDNGPIYFDSVAMFVLFLGGTRFLEMRARQRSDDHALALARLLPDTAMRIRDGQPETIAVDRLRVGDIISIRPGEVIPVDGELTSGLLSVDESVLTGESLPVSRETGDRVFAGGTNRSGNARVRVTLTGASTSLAEIGRLLERAKADRPPLALLADRIASKFVLAVLLIATLTGIVWSNIDISRVVEIVLATLVVTCPCALALATPAALAAAASRLAASGFILVRSRLLEVLQPGAVLVFDKTGTLTKGRPSVVATAILSDDPQWTEGRCLQLVAAIETLSEHVLARAFKEYRGSKSADLLNMQSESGRGVQAEVAGQTLRVGSYDYVREITPTGLAVDEPADGTLVFLGSRDGFIAQFTLGDELRSDAREAVSRLRESGFRIVIASGDRPAAVATVAQTLQVPEQHAGLLPADKLRLVADLQANGHRVIMVGDGINDAPVLAAADASIALDAGTALARASADAIALSRRLMSVVDAATIAAHTRTVIRQNISWAIAYNVIAVPLAASGTLAPWMAALGMSLSSFVVVLNALRIHRHGKHGAIDAPSARPADLSEQVTI